MNRLLVRLPLLITALLVLALLAHGPIAQPAHYHEFADQRSGFALPCVASVLSNAGFAVFGLWGLLSLWPQRGAPSLKAGWPGYCLFLVALTLTAFGSSYYHLAPDDARLVWDRLPIALASAGLLAGVRAETQGPSGDRRFLVMLACCAVASVAWWYATALQGAGDLRPYLLVQGLPLILIPLWQAIHRSPAADRNCFAGALVLYIVAKVAELYDHELLAVLGWISGHTLKHLLATAAAALLVARLVRRVREGEGRAVEQRRKSAPAAG